MNQKKENIIGIDLGTTNSCVSIYINNNCKIIENSEGSRTTPSVISYETNGDIMVGSTAKRQAITNPKRTIYASKRLMGAKFDDPEVKKLIDTLSYQLVKSPNGDAWIEVGDNQIAPQQVAAEILKKMKKTAEDYLGEPISKAVVTVPAYFNDAQRQATKDAGKIAGIDIVRIINEPTAAALAYGYDNKQDQKIAVYDLGGGTFDISIIEVHNVDGENQIEVLSTNGDTFLGGEDFDNVLVKHVVKTFNNSEYIDLSKDKLAIQRIKEACEKAKIELSTLPSTKINLPYISHNNQGPKHIDIEITRSKFEDLIGDLVKSTIKPCEKALEDAKLTKNDINNVILVGGQTRTPLVKKVVKEFFGKELKQDINPDEAVAMGAALQAAVLSGNVKDVLLLDVTPLSLGIETMGNVMTKLIERNTTIPITKKQIFSTATDNQPAVSIVIMQGERPMASDNRRLGTFELEGIEPAKAGVPQIEVSFDINANGILSVEAKDMKTGKSQKITVTGNSGLSSDEIEKMVEEARINTEADAKKVKMAMLKNRVEANLIAIKRFMDEEKNLSEADAKNLNELIVKNQGLIGTNLEEDELTKKCQEYELEFTRISNSYLQKANCAANGSCNNNASPQDHKTTTEEAQEAQIVE